VGRCSLPAAAFRRSNGLTTPTGTKPVVFSHPLLLENLPPTGRNTLAIAPISQTSAYAIRALISPTSAAIGVRRRSRVSTLKSPRREEEEWEPM
jgi:hypothetical protein